MKVVLIIAHNCIRPGAYRGFETVLDRLRKDMPDARIASTSLVDLDNDLRAILREDGIRNLVALLAFERSAFQG